MIKSHSDPIGSGRSRQVETTNASVQHEHNKKGKVMVFIFSSQYFKLVFPAKGAWHSFTCVMLKIQKDVVH